MDGFDIIEKLGNGAYSVVYKVKRKEDGNIYALKKVKLKDLTEKEKQNSLNEVRILASVKSLCYFIQRSFYRRRIRITMHSNGICG